MALRWSPVERLRRVRSDVWGHGWGGGTSFGGPSAGQGPSQKTAYGFQGPAGTRNSVSGNGRQGPRWRFTHKIKQQKKSWLFPWKLYGNWVGTSQTRPSYLSHWDNLKVSSLVTWSENPHPTGWQTAGQYRPGDGQPQLQQYPQQHGWQRGGQRLGGPGSDQSTIKHLVEFRTAWHVSRLSKYELFGSESFISIIFWYLLILYSFKLSLKFPAFFGSMHYCIHLLKNSSFQRFEVRESEPKEPKTSRTSRLSVVVRKRPMNKREVHRVDFPGWFWLCLVGWEKRFFFFLDFCWDGYTWECTWLFEVWYHFFLCIGRLVWSIRCGDLMIGTVCAARRGHVQVEHLMEKWMVSFEQHEVLDMFIGIYCTQEIKPD